MAQQSLDSKMAVSQYSKSELANLQPCESKLESCPRETVVDTFEEYGDSEDRDSTWSLVLSPVASWVVFSEKSTPVCC